MNNIIYKKSKLDELNYFEEIAEKYLRKLFPINRSILNSGVTRSLEIL